MRPQDVAPTEAPTEQLTRAPEPAEPGRRLSLAELALAAAVALALADSSIVVLALPELYSELDTSIPGISWVVTAYNLAVLVGAPLALPLARRFRPAPLAIAGLVVFLVASIVCAASGSLVQLVAGRSVQGIGAALFLVACLPLLIAVGGDRHRAVGLWVGAGTIGAAAGPALGGVLTEAFHWRAIFAVQAPVAAAAIAAAFDRRARAATTPASAPGRLPLGAGLGLALAFAALVGALFLAVLLVVTVWDLGPLKGAGIVSALPLAALAVRPLSARLTGSIDVAAGAGLLAAGLVALALLPASSAVYATLALAIAGAGLGLALPPLTRATLDEEDDLERTTVFSVSARHLGLVVGLVAVAPLLAGALEKGGDVATMNATAVILDAPLPLTQKVPISLDLYREFQATPEGEIPDLTGPFDERAGDDPEVAEVRDDLLEAIQAPLTRAFRSSFFLSALFAVLAAAAALAFRRRTT